MSGRTADTASISAPSRPSTILSGAPRNAHAFTLDTFSSKDFIVKDFIESLSDSAISTRRSAATSFPNSSASQAFDPKPLIRTFEHALSRLKTLSEDLSERENELGGSVRKAEAQYNANIRAREQELHRTVDSFHKLERTLDGGVGGDAGGNVAMRIGERLEELDRQLQRAQDAKFILQCWLEVSEHGDLSTLDDVRKSGGGEGKIRCAHIARQLLKISQRLDPEFENQTMADASEMQIIVESHNGDQEPDRANGARHRKVVTHQPREIIEKFLEMLEKDLLRSFDEFYRRQNFDGMRECALALRDFSEGSSVVSLFVNQHQFFLDRAALVSEDLVFDDETWDRLADPDAEAPGVELSLLSLVDEVRAVVQEESVIVKRAFPYYEEVLARFIQRIFQQSLQQRLELVLNRADEISSLAFLRSLQASRSCIAALVDDLKTHGLTEHPDPASGVIATVLDQQLDELFVPYLAGASYIEREKRNLSELFEGLLFRFTLYHARRRKVHGQATSYLGSLSLRGTEFLSNAREAYVKRLDSTELSSSQKTMLLSIAGLNDKEPTAGVPKNNDVTDEDGQLSLPFTKRMLKWLAESVGRMLELTSGSNETAKDVRTLLNLLLSCVGESYLATALDAATDTAAQIESNSKTEPDLGYLADLRTSVSVLHLMLATIQMLLLPLTANNLTIRRDLEKQTTQFVEQMEVKVDAVMQRTIDASLAWTSRLLATQKKTDFKPKDDANLQLDQLQSVACRSIFTFLGRVHSRAAVALSGQVLDNFNLEIAVGFRTLLLQHFKSYQVSLTGALVVSRDITKYIELLRSWKLPATFDPSLELLTEIANLFVIGPEALRERIRNLGSATAGLQGVDKIELRPYIMRREDAGSVGIQTVLNTL